MHNEEMIAIDTPRSKTLYIINCIYHMNDRDKEFFIILMHKISVFVNVKLSLNKFDKYVRTKNTVFFCAPFTL